MSKVKFEMEKNKFYELLFAALGFVTFLEILFFSVIVLYFNPIVSVLIIIIAASMLGMWAFSLSNIYLVKRLEKE